MSYSRRHSGHTRQAGWSTVLNDFEHTASILHVWAAQDKIRSDCWVSRRYTTHDATQFRYAGSLTPRHILSYLSAQVQPKSTSKKSFDMSAPRSPLGPSPLTLAYPAPPLRAGASKSDPYYERRVVSSPARYAGSPSLSRGSPSHYQYGPAQSVSPAQWPRDDVTYARPAPPRHPLLTQMASDVGGGGGSFWGGGGSRSRGGSLPLTYCSYVEDEAGMTAGPASDWLAPGSPRLAPGSPRRDLALREACGEPADRGVSHLVLHAGFTPAGGYECAACCCWSRRRCSRWRSAAR